MADQLLRGRHPPPHQAAGRAGVRRGALRRRPAVRLRPGRQRHQAQRPHHRPDPRHPVPRLRLPAPGQPGLDQRLGDSRRVRRRADRRERRGSGAVLAPVRIRRQRQPRDPDPQGLERRGRRHQPLRLPGCRFGPAARSDVGGDRHRDRVVLLRPGRQHGRTARTVRRAAKAELGRRRLPRVGRDRHQEDPLCVRRGRRAADPARRARHGHAVRRRRRGQAGHRRRHRDRYPLLRRRRRPHLVRPHPGRSPTTTTPPRSR